MPEDGNGSNEFRKLKILMLNSLSVTRILTLVTFLVMGVIILYQCNSKKPEGGTVTRIDTARTAPVIINNWPASSTVQGQRPPDVNVSGMDSAQLRAMLESYLQKYRELFAEHTAVNRYDTTFKDSTYKETLSMEVTRNRLARFTRNMEVYHRTTTIVKPPRFAVLGGAFGYSDGLHTAAGVQMGLQPVNGNLYLVGYDVLNRGWYGSVLVKIRVRK
jgi:hypothetical protein